MQMYLDGNNLVVVREEHDPKFYGTVNAAGESRFLYHLARHLQWEGVSLIKKRMWKDGHMVDDMQQYLRAKPTSQGPHIALYNPSWAIRGLNDDFNEGQAVLAIVYDVFGKQGEEECKKHLECLISRWIPANRKAA